MPFTNESLPPVSLFRQKSLSNTLLAVFIIICWSSPARPDELKNTTSKKILPSQRPFQSVRFSPEPQTAPADKLAQPHSSFEGKAATKDSLGRFVPLKLPIQPSALEYMKPTGQNRLGGPDIFVDFGSETSIAVNYDDDP